MGYHIHVIIEQRNEVYPMSHSREKEKGKDRIEKRRDQYAKHKKHPESHHREPTTYPKAIPTPNPIQDLKDEPELKERIRTIKESREESSSDSNRFFHSNTLRTQGAVQTTNVSVTVNEPAKDCLSSCFGGLAKCFGKK
jgi:hypothetical protein